MEDDISRMASSDNFLVVSLKVEDKFGDSGLTGVAIVEKGNNEWRLDSFLLSCRVLGRKVEDTLLTYVVDEAAKSGANFVKGEFIPTKKNAPARDFFGTHGFKRTETKNDGSEIWQFSIKQRQDFPQFVKVVVR
jgi:FkbH-like protein